MFTFIRAAMIMESLHGKEVDTRDWGIAMVGFTIILFERIWTLILWVRKAMQCFMQCLMGHSGRSIEDNGAKCYLNCGMLTQKVSEEIILVLFW